MAIVDESTELWLEQWGRWSRKGRLGPDVGKCGIAILVDRANEQVDKTHQYDADDDLMECFDLRVMRFLMESERPGSKEMYRNLRDYFRGVQDVIDGRTVYRQMGIRDLARHYRIDRDMMSAKLRQAICRVTGMLEVMAA